MIDDADLKAIAPSGAASTATASHIDFLENRFADHVVIELGIEQSGLQRIFAIRHQQLADLAAMPRVVLCKDQFHELARLSGESANQLFNTLDDWNRILTDTSMAPKGP